MKIACIAVTMATITLVSCSTTAEPETQTVTGTVTYRERIALPPDAVLEMQLQDVSLADAPARVISTQVINPAGSVPIAFSLAYEPGAIDPQSRYALQARIEQGDRLLFINDTHTPVLTHGGGTEADMILVKVQVPAAEAAAGEELVGLFSYMADAAGFTDCRNWRNYPVAMEGAYIDLERAYSAAREEPGSKMLVRLKGRYLSRPSMEGDRQEVHLIVDQFESIEQATCDPLSNASLDNTWWRLAVLGGQMVVVPEQAREPHMVLQDGSLRVRGHGGCNDFFGSYQVEADAITFSAMGSTMKACPWDDGTEHRFLTALPRANRYRIMGEVLELFEDDYLLARFEAVYH